MYQITLNHVADSFQNAITKSQQNTKDLGAEVSEFI